jgi:orotidine-5'-phosphate decarboxylase
MPAAIERSPAGVLRFLAAVVDATREAVASYKLNLAFYERWGKEGNALLDQTLGLLPQDKPVIFDAKRGDLGSTAQAYAYGIFKSWGADAVTVNPYLGHDSVAPFLAYHDRHTFILCRTSNPGANDFQHLRVDGEPLFRRVARTAVSWDRHDNLGLVVGATAPVELREVRQIAGERLLLVPGIGAQGGDLDTAVRAALRPDGRGGGHAVRIARARGEAQVRRGTRHANAPAHDLHRHVRWSPTVEAVVRALERVRRDRGAQLVQVAVQKRWVQQESVASRRDRAFTERRAQHVHREVEQSTRIGQITFGPEECHRPVAGERLRPCGDDERQQRDAVTLGRWAAEGDISGAQRRAPEQLDHDHRSRVPLIRG